MRKNLDDNFSYKLGQNLGFFKMKISLNITVESQSCCFPKNRYIGPIFKGFLYQHFKKKSSNAFSIVVILQYLSYKLFL